MLGISFFGVTPGFSQRNFSRNLAEMNAALSECSHLSTLDQFSINIPAGGVLYVFGGQSTQYGQIRFIGQFRHAIEYGGNRGGGYGGAGIWLRDSWINGESAVDFIAQMTDFIRAHLVDDNERFIRNFDQIDWSEAEELASWLQEGTSVFSDSESYREPGQQPHKVLIAEPFFGKAANRKEMTIRVIQYIGRSLDAIQNRIVYLSYNRDVIDATARIGRVQSMTFDEFTRKRSHWISSLIKSSSVHTSSRIPHSETVSPRSSSDQWNQEPSPQPVSDFASKPSSNRESRYPFQEPPPPVEISSPQTEGRSWWQNMFKSPWPNARDISYRIMILYCFCAVNIIIMAILTLFYTHINDRNRFDIASGILRKSAEGTAMEAGEPSLNPAADKTASSRAGSDNPTSVGSGREIEANNPQKTSADFPCPRGSKGKTTSIDQMALEAQIFAGNTRSLEGRIDRMRQNDAKLNLSREEVDLLYKLFQREKAYFSCLNQLQQEQARLPPP